MCNCGRSYKPSSANAGGVMTIPSLTLPPAPPSQPSSGQAVSQSVEPPAPPPPKPWLIKYQAPGEK